MDEMGNTGYDVTGRWLIEMHCYLEQNILCLLKVIQKKNLIPHT